MRRKQKKKSRFKRIVRYIFSFNIATKMLLAFISLLSLIVIISLFTLISLKKINNINSSILKTDVPLIEASEKMIETILSEELYANKYFILKTSQMQKMFTDKKKEFVGLVNEIISLTGKERFDFEKIISLHNDYNKALNEKLIYGKKRSSRKLSKIEKKIKKNQGYIIDILDKMATDALHDQSEKNTATAQIGADAFRMTTIICGVGLFFSFFGTIFIIWNITVPIKKLNYATRMIAKGKFNYNPGIRNRDELGDLSKAFVEMAKRLKDLEEMYLDSSPLTRLPGGIAIENVLTKRIKNKEKIAFCIMDLDNFKSYNDNYGYSKGNELIIYTARIIEKIVAKRGKNDFIGHIGGDDFVLITTPDRADLLCKAVIKYFDKGIPNFYNNEDRDRGYIIGENRQGQEVCFPLASISIGIVTNKIRRISSHLQFGEIAVELKEYAKSLPGSVFVTDQRNDKKRKKEKSNSNLIRLPKGRRSKKG